ncbi:MAG: penicillin acylase family protein [Gammaproteobacteria bacterium]|nr:penicillin acylase family protein [Gammaproteobacteria bacterium]
MFPTSLNWGLLAALGCIVGVVATAGEAPQPADPYPGAGEVAIYRDGWGVPHVYAEVEENGYFGLAYALASDQLERFLLSIHAARGTVAQHIEPGALPWHIMGPLSVEQTVEVDYQARLWSLRSHAETAVDGLHPQVRRNYAGFVDGINAYLADHPDRVPHWAPADIEIADLIAAPLGLLWSDYSAGIGINDCRRGGVQVRTAAELTASMPGTQSNQWAVMPSRTATGGAILLTDPHGGMDGRFTYEYVMHAGEFHATGYALGPALFLGRNRHVGWGLTTGSPDVADCYEIATVEGDPGKYPFDGVERAFVEKTITIAVKDREPLTVTAEYTDHNEVPSPVVARDGDRAWVVSTPYYANLEGLANVARAMNMATSVNEFFDAQRAGWMFPQNLLAADRNGDILYVRAGMTPVRPDPDIDWLRPVDGNSSDTAWQGIHEAEDLLVIRSPAAGYLQNNNVAPTFMDTRPPPQTHGKPTYLLTAGYTTGPNSRGQRAIDVLSETEQMTEADAFALAFDTLSLGWERFITPLRAGLKDAGLSPDVRHFADDLLSFDGHLDAESTAALKYLYWRESLRTSLAGIDRYLLRDVIERGMPPDGGVMRAMVAGLEDAAARMATMPHGLGRRYGDEFRVGGREGRDWPMSGGRIAPGGALHLKDQWRDCDMGQVYFCPTTLFAVSYRPRGFEKWVAFVGSRIMRLDFYSPGGIRSHSLQNPGISDDPESRHADDQAELLTSQRKMKPVRFEWEELRPHVESVVLLQRD